MRRLMFLTMISQPCYRKVQNQVSKLNREGWVLRIMFNVVFVLIISPAVRSITGSLCMGRPDLVLVAWSVWFRPKATRNDSD